MVDSSLFSSFLSAGVSEVSGAGAGVRGTNLDLNPNDFLGLRASSLSFKAFSKTRTSS